MKWGHVCFLGLLCTLQVYAQSKNLTAVSNSIRTVQSSAQPELKVLFAPDEDVQGAFIALINGAKAQILLQAYLLTDDKISDALIAAHKRHVDVRVLMDAERAYEAIGSDGVRLKNAGIPVRLETRYENAHNKVMIVDWDTVVTGSYNFTYTAQRKNAENAVFIKNAPKLIARYIKNWHSHNAHAVDLKK